MLLLIVCAIVGGLAGYGACILLGWSFPFSVALLTTTASMAGAGIYLARARASEPSTDDAPKDKQVKRKSLA